MSKLFNSLTCNEVTLSDKMPYGKYKGALVADLVQSQPAYILWCSERYSGISKEVLTKAKTNAIIDDMYKKQVLTQLNPLDLTISDLFDDVPF